MTMDSGDRQLPKGQNGVFYVYPDFGSVRDLGLFRVGGAGLANCLLSWAKASVIAERSGAVRLSPTWPSLKIGPIIRRERDWRHYLGLFVPEQDSISGLKRLQILATAKRVTLSKVSDVCVPQPDTIYVVNGSNVAPDYFDGLFDHRQDIVARLLAMTQASVKARADRNATADIAVHVRLGDFGAVPQGTVPAAAAVNLRLPIDWYVDRIERLRATLARPLSVTIFSDGTDEELLPLLRLPDTRRATGGNALSDILSLSRAPILVASGSTFSMWASFIGAGVSLWAPGRLFQKLKADPDGEIETALGDELPASFVAAAERALDRRRG